MIFCCLLHFSSQVSSQELGHYIPGVWDIRNFISPPPGYYFALYNYFYNSQDLKNQNGNSIQSATIKGVSVPLAINVQNYLVAPTFIWAPKRKIMGANYALIVLQPLANPSLQASLQILSTGLSANQSSWGLSDSYARPLWLTWRWPTFDFSASYAFYAPTGRYHNRNRNNVGLGFWTHEFQLAGAWSPDEEHLLSIILAATYDLNQQKTDVNIRPGNYFSLNWGISKLFPIGQQGILELGIPGYDQWQTTNDSGTAALLNPTIRPHVHAAGLQLGYTIIPLNLVITGKFFQEFKAKARFQGRVYTLSFSLKF